MKTIREKRQIAMITSHYLTSQGYTQSEALTIGWEIANTEESAFVLEFKKLKEERVTKRVVSRNFYKFYYFKGSERKKTAGLYKFIDLGKVAVKERLTDVKAEKTRIFTSAYADRIITDDSNYKPFIKKSA